MKEGKLSIPPLDTENFASWSTRMEAALDYKGLWEYVKNSRSEGGRQRQSRFPKGQGLHSHERQGSTPVHTS